MDDEAKDKDAVELKSGLSTLMSALADEREFRSALRRVETALLASGDVEAVAAVIERLEAAATAADQGRWSVHGTLPEYAARTALKEAINDAWQVLSSEQRMESLRAIDIYRIPGETEGITSRSDEKAEPAPLPGGNTMRFILETLRTLTGWSERTMQNRTAPASAADTVPRTIDQP